MVSFQRQGAELRVVAHGVVLADVEREIGHAFSVAFVEGERARAEVLAHQRLDAFDCGGNLPTDPQGFAPGAAAREFPAVDTGCGTRQITGERRQRPVDLAEVGEGDLVRLSSGRRQPSAGSP